MSEPVTYEISSVTFEPGGIAIQYIGSTDVRVQGRVMVAHQAMLSAGHPDYAEDIELLHRQAVKMLKNALSDFHDSEPYVPDEDPEDDDDERGMGE